MTGRIYRKFLERKEEGVDVTVEFCQNSFFNLPLIFKLKEFQRKKKFLNCIGQFLLVTSFNVSFYSHID